MLGNGHVAAGSHNKLNESWELWVLVDPSGPTKSHESDNELNELLVSRGPSTHRNMHNEGKNR